MTTPLIPDDELQDDWDDIFDGIRETCSDCEHRRCLDIIKLAKKLIHSAQAEAEREARIQAAKDIFNLAHEYAQQDKTMHGSDLRGYHYFNAIHKIGGLDGR